jgi:hypothetical protein
LLYFDLAKNSFAISIIRGNRRASNQRGVRPARGKLERHDLGVLETVAGCWLTAGARQKDGRQVVPVDVDRDDVAYPEEIGILEGSSRDSIGRALALLLRECQRRGVGR